MTSEVKTILAAESISQLDEVRKFMDTLDRDGQKSLLDFFSGAKFMQNLMHARLANDERPTADRSRA